MQGFHWAPITVSTLSVINLSGVISRPTAARADGNQRQTVMSHKESLLSDFNLPPPQHLQSIEVFWTYATVLNGIDIESGR